MGVVQEDHILIVHCKLTKISQLTNDLLVVLSKVVLQQSNQVADSVNTIPLKDATTLGEGAYTVQLILNNKTYTTRFLIWK